MAGRLNQTMREAIDQEGQPGLRDQEISVAKMAESYRSQAGGRVGESPAPGREGFRVGGRVRSVGGRPVLGLESNKGQGVGSGWPLLGVTREIRGMSGN